MRILTSNWGGGLYFAIEDYENAEKCLLNTIEKDRELAIAYSNLGIIHLYNEDYKSAIKYFRNAFDKLDREDLMIQSNLAEAYRKAGDVYSAKTEYEKILNITPFHVESYIGLGEVYSALGDGGDEDMYDKAIYNFTHAINISNKKNGSKILKGKELAAALYSRGYAKVGLYEKSKTIMNEGLLRDALKDFKESYKKNPYNHKAKRGMGKIEKRAKILTPQRFIERLGPWAIFLSSFFVFILSQSCFIFNKPHSIAISYYGLLTLGSFIFMVTGLYLPQILKLKVGSIELEKSPVEQITAPTTLGIRK